MRIDNRLGKIAALVVFTAICLATFAVLYVAAGGSIRFSKPYTIKAIVPSAFQLVKNGDVRHAGVKIGKVTDITNRGADGVVTMEIQKKYQPIYRDGTVQLRTKTLVGENYLDINPGDYKSGKLPDGGTLPIQQAKPAVQLDEVLSTLDKRTRQEVRRNLDGLGIGVKGRGEDINRLFAASRPLAVDGGDVSRILRAQKQPVADVIEDTGRVMKAFADRTAQVRSLAVQAKRTAVAVASRDEAFTKAINQLDPALRQARESVNRLGSFAGRATPVAADLTDDAKLLEPVARDLRPAASETRAVFKQLPQMVSRINPALTKLDQFSGALQPAIGPLDANLRQLIPALDYIKPFAKEFGSFFANSGQINAYHDATGALGRVHLMMSDSTLTMFSPSTRKAVDALLHAGVGQLIRNEQRNSNPEPGTIGDPNDRNAYRQVTELGK
jgi:phospholipid/cholesterol/gamma-HCH transport system substrate-binding protein